MAVLRRLEEATASSKPPLLPKDGPLVGFSAYKNLKAGALAYHMAMFWMDDPTKVAPGNSEELAGKYWTCADVGEGALQNAETLETVQIRGKVNIEVSFSLGPDGSSGNLKHPAIDSVLIGKRPQYHYEGAPSYMGYVKAPKGLTLAKFLATARSVGSTLLEMGGYDLVEAKNCQTFTGMMLVQLGLKGLQKVAFDGCISDIGLPHRAHFKNTNPDNVRTCMELGSTGNMANLRSPALDYSTCLDKCDVPVSTGLRVKSAQFVELVYCLPDIDRCPDKAVICGQPGMPACLDDYGTKICDGEEAHGFCVSTSDEPGTMMIVGDKYVAGGHEKCPSLARPDAGAEDDGKGQNSAENGDGN